MHSSPSRSSAIPSHSGGHCQSLGCWSVCSKALWEELAVLRPAAHVTVAVSGSLKKGQLPCAAGAAVRGQANGACSVIFQPAAHVTSAVSGLTQSGQLPCAAGVAVRGQANVLSDLQTFGSRRLFVLAVLWAQPLHLLMSAAC